MSNFQLPAGFRPSAPPSSSAGPSSGVGNGQGPEEQAAARERAAAQEEMKRGMISAMLEPEARERLSRISLTRPQMGQQVTEMLVRMGQQGQIRGKVTDEALKGLLEQISRQSSAQPASTQAPPPSARTKTLGGGITIQRKGDDSDSDEYDL